MPYLALLILFALPFADVLVTARVAQWLSVPLWLLLVASAVLGWMVLRRERAHFRARALAALQSSAEHGLGNTFRSVLDSGRRVIAGLLLIVPGLVSDSAALLLLLVPIAYKSAPLTQTNSATPQTVEGSYRRLD